MRARILTLVVLLLLVGCSSVPSLPYKIEVQQGNVITQEMVDKLKPGMTRSQVRFALGSPMISDAFHENRWDYVYRLEQVGRLVEQRNLTVFFEDDKLARLGGSFSLAAFNRPTMQHMEASRPAGALPPEPAESAPTAPVAKEESSAPVASNATPPSTISASNASGTASGNANASGPPRPKKPSSRDVPSQATDMGDEEADQPKE
jgi:outer membrane protein assembly factor BamE